MRKAHQVMRVKALPSSEGDEDLKIPGSCPERSSA